MSELTILSILILLFITFLFLSSFIKILKEYERGVVFMLGRFYRVKGPGLVILIPFIQTMTRIELRTLVMDVPTQDVISKDNISTKVNAVVYFKVIDPEKAIIQVANFIEATGQLAQTTLRSVLGEHELDEMLSQREQLNTRLRKILDEQTDCWGIKVTQVEIKDVDIDESMRRAIAKQAEAERDRRAKVIHADGELQASTKLSEAADILAKSPGAIQLRYLDTLSNISSDKSHTIVFPIDILTKLLDKNTGETS
ncbi:slipin family protein [Candidatus Synchoanobacter obligatus]|uniref:Slipin family protein n=1 Tax=Candidatus Synchoanobacter obligatus TaxID=2919597 RepID=A0ABT1L5H4_9GAMM|nr:slipin family protein [Candidatus Synchoanobacter obligatus]MCP8352420.1 slipin family protein [Candidatus Synchoanobacter obligatus]